MIKFLSITLLVSYTMSASIPRSKHEDSSLFSLGGGFQEVAQQNTADNSGLFRRNNVIGQGDSGGTVEDSSHNTSVNTIGDAFGSGENNVFAPVSNIFMGPSTDLLFRRDFLDGVGMLGSSINSNRDKSANSNIFTKGNQMLTGQHIQDMSKLTTGGLSAVNTAQ
jgi:hypothetical protein